MSKDSRFPWGISLLAFGVLFLLRQLGIFSPEIDNLIFDLRNVLLVLGIVFLISYKNKSIGIILLVVWILFYLKDIIIWTKSLSDFIWPVLLIAAGALLLYNGKDFKKDTTEIASKDDDKIETTK